jgi:peptide/nickel transport system permease protein
MIFDVRIADEDGLRWPYVYNTYYEFDEYQRKIWREDTSVKYPLQLFSKGDTHNVLWLFRTRRHLMGIGNLDQYTGDERNKPTLFLLGADEFGRDVFSRLLYGGRISLSVGLFGVAITFFLGMIIGGASGYFGGRTDMVIQRLCEMLMLVPGFYLLLSLRAAVPTHWSSVQTYVAIIVILSFIGWAGLARTIRGLVLSIAQMEYVLAARATGAKNGLIIVRHVLPNTFSYAIVAATMSIPGYVLGESGLSLIGLGISDPEASWGNMLAAAMDIAQIKFHPWILILSFNYLGDGLRDAFDPRGVQKRG